MSGGDLCVVFSSLGENAAELLKSLLKLKEALAAASEEAAERLENIKEAITEAWEAEEIRELIREEHLDWLSAINEKKKRRIKRKDRVLRWFVMVAHPESHRRARERTERPAERRKPVFR